MEESENERSLAWCNRIEARVREAIESGKTDDEAWQFKQWIVTTPLEVGLAPEARATNALNRLESGAFSALLFVLSSQMQSFGTLVVLASLVVVVPVVIREEGKPVFRRRLTPHRAVDEGADAEVVNRPRGRDEMLRLSVVDEPLPFVELGDVSTVSSVDTVGIVEVQHTMPLLSEYPWVAIVRCRHCVLSRNRVRSIDSLSSSESVTTTTRRSLTFFPVSPVSMSASRVPNNG